MYGCSPPRVHSSAGIVEMEAGCAAFHRYQSLPPQTWQRALSSSLRNDVRLRSRCMARHGVARLGGNEQRVVRVSAYIEKRLYL